MERLYMTDLNKVIASINNINNNNKYIIKDYNYIVLNRIIDLIKSSSGNK